jgi:hypothetical protein
LGDDAPGMKPETVKQYEGDWHRFTAWCEANDRLAYPASPETVGAFLVAALATHKSSYAARHLTTIRLFHQMMYRPLDDTHPAITAVVALFPAAMPKQKTSGPAPNVVRGTLLVPGTGGVVRLTQIDGKLPNIALMKLARHYQDRGYELRFSKHVDRDMLEPTYDRVYGSAIFSYSQERVARFREQFPAAIVGGTHDLTDNTTVEQHLGIDDNERYDYSIYPKFDGSIGFTQRGCRLKCGFCVVPKKEGKPRSVNTIASIWRRDPYPRHIHLLDNDFFGQAREEWEARIAEIIDGKFKVCLNQGINIRLVNEEVARALGHLPYYDDQFRVRRLYTAWDNIGDEERFFRGVDLLETNGIPPTHIMAYMLVGYDHRETWERVFYRFNKMVSRGIKPFPMIYGNRHRTIPLGSINQRIGHRTLKEFQAWAVRRTFAIVPFEHFNADHRGIDNAQLDLFPAN